MSSSRLKAHPPTQEAPSPSSARRRLSSIPDLESKSPKLETPRSPVSISIVAESNHTPNNDNSASIIASLESIIKQKDDIINVQKVALTSQEKRILSLEKTVELLQSFLESK